MRFPTLQGIIWVLSILLFIGTFLAVEENAKTTFWPSILYGAVVLIVEAAAVILMYRIQCRRDELENPKASRTA